MHGLRFTNHALYRSLGVGLLFPLNDCIPYLQLCFSISPFSNCATIERSALLLENLGIICITASTKRRFYPWTLSQTVIRLILIQNRYMAFMFYCALEPRLFHGMDLIHLFDSGSPLASSHLKAPTRSGSYLGIKLLSTGYLFLSRNCTNTWFAFLFD